MKHKEIRAKLVRFFDFILDEFTAAQSNQQQSQQHQQQQPPLPSNSQSQPYSQPLLSQPLDSPASNRGEHSFFTNNTQLSQITTDDTVVNRRLFGTPLNTNNASNRLASTPFTGQAMDTPNPYRFRFDDGDDFAFENNLPPPMDQYENSQPQHRKRRLDDLFGDIDDILREENRVQVFYSEDIEENAKKKARSEEEMDKALIDRILAARAEFQARSSQLKKQSKLQELEALHKFKARNLSETYPQWPCIPVVCADRDRIYVRMHSEEFEKNQLKELTLRARHQHLLGNSSEDIWNEAQKIVEKRMTAAAEEQTNAMSEIDQVVIISETNPNAGKLWVEKYRPKGYFDLLSDESTNRSLLTWLKMWDKVVFNR